MKDEGGHEGVVFVLAGGDFPRLDNSQNVEMSISWLFRNHWRQFFVTLPRFGNSRNVEMRDCIHPDALPVNISSVSYPHDLNEPPSVVNLVDNAIVSARIRQSFFDPVIL